MSDIVGVCIIKARDFLINSVIGKRKRHFISLCLLNASLLPGVLIFHMQSCYQLTNHRKSGKRVR